VGRTLHLSLLWTYYRLIFCYMWRGRKAPTLALHCMAHSSQPHISFTLTFYIPYLTKLLARPLLASRTRDAPFILLRSAVFSADFEHYHSPRLPCLGIQPFAAKRPALPHCRSIRTATTSLYTDRAAAVDDTPSNRFAHAILPFQPCVSAKPH